MADIIISREVMEDLVNNTAVYIKDRTLRFTGIKFSKDSVSFFYKSRRIAFIEIPEKFSFDNGDTVTIKFGGLIQFTLE